MGPLLPLGVLFGGLWYLDKEKPGVGAGATQAPRFPAAAVAAVTVMSGNVRCYARPEAISLSTYSLEQVSIENGPQGVVMFKLLPHIELGALPADKAVQQAVDKGLACLASLSTVLSEPGTHPMLLMFCRQEDVAKYAGPNSHMALLAMRPPVPADAGEAPAPTPGEAIRPPGEAIRVGHGLGPNVAADVEATVVEELPKKRRNGLVKVPEPEPILTVTTEQKADA